MGLLDTILGRSKPVAANLDDLFAIPSAAVTLQAADGRLGGDDDNAVNGACCGEAVLRAGGQFSGHHNEPGDD